jgi:arylsulfatase A-like enzyme
MRRSVLALLTLALLTVTATAAPAAPARMNVVFLLVDDLGWADTSCYGRKEWKTPQIDRLASEGCRFTDACAAGPICSASRAAILSGKHPARLHLTDWIPGFAYPQESPLVPIHWTKKLAETQVALPNALAEAGYATAIIGKWHVGGHPTKQGFQQVIQMSSANECDRFKGGRFMTDRKGDAALTFLEENRAKPFFLYFATNAVHVPIAAAPEKIAKHADALCFHYPHYSQHAEGQPGGAIRQGDWKLVELFETGKLELYNLKDDLGERNNLAQKEPARSAQLLDRLRHWQQDVGAQVPVRKDAPGVSQLDLRPPQDEIRVGGRPEEVLSQLMLDE